MTVSTQYQPFTFQPGAAMSSEAVPWQFLDGAHLLVTHIQAGTGLKTVLSPGDDYSVGGNGRDGTGSITPLDPYPALDEWRVERVTALVQENAMPPFESLDAFAVEREADRQVFALQEQVAEGARALKVEKDQISPPVDLSGLVEFDLLQYRGGKIQRLRKELLAGAYWGGDGLGNLVPLGAPLGTSLPLASNITINGGGDLQSYIDDNDAALSSLLDMAEGDINPARFRQLIQTNLYKMNSRGNCGVILGDSISQNSYSGNGYTYHWAMNLARAVNATFGGRSLPTMPLEGSYSGPMEPALNSPQVFEVLFEGDWGAMNANPVPFNYPIGRTGAAAANIRGGKSYYSTSAGAKITITGPSICERLVMFFTKQLGGGAFTATMNGNALPGVNCANATTVYNADGVVFAVSDNGKGRFTLVLTKADNSPTEVHNSLGMLSDASGQFELDKRMRIDNFSQAGRCLSHMSEANIIQLTDSVFVDMCLGYNDEASLLTDTDNAAFAAFKQRIDWLIYYANLNRTPMIVSDFIWYDAATSRTRQELKRLAREVNGYYIPFAEWFFSNGVPPIKAPPQLNDPVAAWADTAHPARFGQDMLTSVKCVLMGLAISSRQVALAYHDWAYPLEIDDVNAVNAQPNFIRQISTIRQCGPNNYIMVHNVKHASLAQFPQTPDLASLRTLWSGLPVKYRDGQLQFLAESFGCNVNPVSGVASAGVMVDFDGGNPRVRMGFCNGVSDTLAFTKMLTVIT